MSTKLAIAMDVRCPHCGLHLTNLGDGTVRHYGWACELSGKTFRIPVLELEEVVAECQPA